MGALDFVRERVWEVLLACKFLSFVSLRVEELHDILGVYHQFLRSLTTTIQRLSRVDETFVVAFGVVFTLRELLNLFAQTVLRSLRDFLLGRLVNLDLRDR